MSKIKHIQEWLVKNGVKSITVTDTDATFDMKGCDTDPNHLGDNVCECYFETEELPEVACWLSPRTIAVIANKYDVPVTILGE